jgi:hypothetical protein
MAIQYEYSQLMRPIGQMLETLRIECFSIIADGDGFVVRDRTRNRAQLTPREKAFLDELHAQQSGDQERADAKRLASGVLEWRLGQVDLERLERDGQSKRRDDAKLADSHSTSQVLRVVGGIIDQKRARLISLTRDEQSVTVEFEAASGQKVTESYAPAVLYDYWVRMYKRRS